MTPKVTVGAAGLQVAGKAGRLTSMAGSGERPWNSPEAITPTTFIGGYFGRAMTTTTQGTVAEKPRLEVTVALNRWLRPAATDSGPHSRDPSRTRRSRPG
jgi:hypothetical protein